MLISRLVWCLLAALTVSECWAAIPNKRQTLPSIDNSLPLSDKDAEEGDFVMQMPSCLAVKGVCARKQNCQDEYIYEASDLCGEQADTVCCLTRSTFEKHVLQLKACADTGSVCAFEEDCPEQDRHSNPLLCGEQPGVTCCKTLPNDVEDPQTRRAHNVQLFSCEANGGICRDEEQCPEADRRGNSDMCGDQPYITCCQASNLDSPNFPLNSLPEKKSVDKEMFELKYKRRAHSVQIESCEAQGGICRPNNKCPEGSRLGTFDTCGDNPLITCCQLSLQSNEIPSKKRSSEQLPSSYQKKSSKLGPQRPIYLPVTVCESKGGTCRQESQCSKQNRLGSSDLCADEPNVTCCHSSSGSPESVEERKKRRAHSVQLESCKAQYGMCTFVTNCPVENQLGVDMCGGLDNITCCHLSFLESAMSSDISQEEQSDNVKEKRRAHSVQLQSCRAQGGMCRQTDECPETDRLGPDSCGSLPYITCCQKSNNSVSSEIRSIGLPTFNLRCLMRGGLCKKDVDCFPEDRYEGSELCGNQEGVSCCKRLPPRVGECSARGGECVAESVCQNGPRDQFGQCSGGNVCCVWT